MENVTKMMLLVVFLFLLGTGISGYYVYETYKPGDWQLVNSAFSVGLFLTSAMYYSTIMFMQNRSKERTLQITELMLENLELKEEIFILQMPHIGKKEKL